ncbi:MAG: restriction endonuclease subunit S [Sulfuritalea sp.]|nr:restriction endonuclease subunit S [Sulfuritalea sp.]
MEVREPSAKYLARTAFKQTDVGLIPGDWSVSTIGDLASTSSGTTPPRAQANKYFENGSIPWVKTLDLNNGSIVSTDETITPAALSETSLQLYPNGSVLVAMYGGYNQIGRTGILEISATVNQALTAIRPDTKRLHPGYLLRVLNHRIDYWRTVASSSRKDPNITSKDIREFPLAVPPIPEQQAIAEALSDADALIESLEQLLAKKRQIKQGAMQELLTGQKRLPGFAGSGSPPRLEQLASSLKARVSHATRHRAVLCPASGTARFTRLTMTTSAPFSRGFPWRSPCARLGLDKVMCYSLALEKQKKRLANASRSSTN